MGMTSEERRQELEADRHLQLLTAIILAGKYASGDYSMASPDEAEATAKLIVSEVHDN